MSQKNHPNRGTRQGEEEYRQLRKEEKYIKATYGKTPARIRNPQFTAKYKKILALVFAKYLVTHKLFQKTKNSVKLVF